jgi:hypothetical protein
MYCVSRDDLASLVASPKTLGIATSALICLRCTSGQVDALHNCWLHKVEAGERCPDAFVILCPDEHESTTAGQSSSSTPHSAGPALDPNLPESWALCERYNRVSGRSEILGPVLKNILEHEGFLAPDSSVWDVGCGSGEFACLLSPKVRSNCTWSVSTSLSPAPLPDNVFNHLKQKIPSKISTL